MNADKALTKLIEGNEHYVEATNNGAELVTNVSRSPANQGQKPFAIVLGCSDSRVPVETIFHQGIGDLFVIRVAGNIVDSSLLGSIEFACHNFGTQLVVVLGHSHCGAVKATVETLKNKPDEMSPNIASIVDAISPAVLPTIASCEGQEDQTLFQSAMVDNVAHSVAALQQRSTILEDLVKNDKLKIVGADYSLETGKVNFH